MAGDKRILTEVLLDAATNAALGDAEYLSERVRAALLLNSSNSPQSCAEADGIAYAIHDDWRGVVVRNADVSLSMLTEAFARLDAVPTGLLEREPDLTLEDFRAAMLVITALLRGFEGPAGDGQR